MKTKDDTGVSFTCSVIKIIASCPSLVLINVEWITRLRNLTTVTTKHSTDPSKSSNPFPTLHYLFRNMIIGIFQIWDSYTLNYYCPK